MRRQKIFLLKLWNDTGEGDTWRASLEDLRTQDKRYFAATEDLLNALCDLMTEADNTAGTRLQIYPDDVTPES